MMKHLLGVLLLALALPVHADEFSAGFLSEKVKSLSLTETERQRLEASVSGYFQQDGYIQNRLKNDYPKMTRQEQNLVLHAFGLLSARKATSEQMSRAFEAMLVTPELIRRNQPLIRD